MGTKEKLVERFLRLPNDFTFEELTRLLGNLGYEQCNKGKTSGSRLMFRKGNDAILIHKPHPGNVVKKYALKQVLEKIEGQLNQ